MKVMNITIPKEKIAQFCRQWKIIEFSLFGSVLREDFGTESDIDVLVTFSPEAIVGLFEFGRMQEELEKLFGRDVDLVSRRGIEASRNYLRRKAITENAEVLYAEG
jgi:uncharacterized protein